MHRSHRASHYGACAGRFAAMRCVRCSLRPARIRALEKAATNQGVASNAADAPTRTSSRPVFGRSRPGVVSNHCVTNGRNEQETIIAHCTNNRPQRTSLRSLTTSITNARDLDCGTSSSLARTSRGVRGPSRSAVFARKSLECDATLGGTVGCQLSALLASSWYRGLTKQQVLELDLELGEVGVDLTPDNQAQGRKLRTDRLADDSWPCRRPRDIMGIPPTQNA